MSKSQRIIRNSLLLYLRMGIVMIVTLYTSRKVLELLGIDDFGLYNTIGGVVLIFTFVNAALSSSTARFLAYELGKSDYSAYTKTFNISLVLHLSIALLFLLLAETIGLFFVNTYLNLPLDRMQAAGWVYQLSVISACVNIVRVPFNSWVIAFEDFTFYAYIGVVEAVLRVLFVFLLFYLPGDKVILYAGLVMLLSVLITLCFYVYCRKQPYYHFYFVKKRDDYMGQIKFSAYRLFGASSQLAEQQGGNVIVNIYYGVTVNAAMGISNQVNAAINSLLAGFQNAFQPVITKLYASDEKEELFLFVSSTAKYSILLFCFLAIPLVLNIDYILHIWLSTVPDCTSIFCVLIIICSAIEAFSAPLWMVILATGNITAYQIILSTLTFLGFLVAFLSLFFGASVESIFYYRIMTYACILLFRLYWVRRQINFPFYDFLKSVILRSLFTVTISYAVTLTICCDLYGLERLLLSGISHLAIFTIIHYFFYLNNAERNKLRYLLLKKQIK